jgi:hypothetical protein
MNKERTEDSVGKKKDGLFFKYKSFKNDYKIRSIKSRIKDGIKL